MLFLRDGYSHLPMNLEIVFASLGSAEWVKNIFCHRHLWVTISISISEFSDWILVRAIREYCDLYTFLVGLSPKYVSQWPVVLVLQCSILGLFTHHSIERPSYTVRFWDQPHFVNFSVNRYKYLCLLLIRVKQADNIKANHQYFSNFVTSK